jgi:hypothetical protein
MGTEEGWCEMNGEMVRERRDRDDRERETTGTAEGSMRMIKGRMNKGRTTRARTASSPPH